MKVIFIRHAKSSWSQPILEDHARPLNDRGIKNAPEMGLRLKRLGLLPEAIYTSTALRAASTAQLVATAIGFDKGLKKHPELYHASASQLLKFLRNIPDKYDLIYLVAHNPGMTDFANLYTDLEIDNLPTCGIFGFEVVSSDWQTNKPTFKSFLYDFPKNQS